jgi:hypothetical protein
MSGIAPKDNAFKYKIASHKQKSIVKICLAGPQQKLKIDSCLRGAILNLTAFCSIWTLIGECSSIAYLLIEIYFNNFILQALITPLKTVDKRWVINIASG